MINVGLIAARNLCFKTKRPISWILMIHIFFSDLRTPMAKIFWSGQKLRVKRHRFECTARAIWKEYLDLLSTFWKPLGNLFSLSKIKFKVYALGARITFAIRQRKIIWIAVFNSLSILRTIWARNLYLRTSCKNDHHHFLIASLHSPNIVKL